MSKPLKNIMTKELTTRYAELDSVVVINPVGLNAIDSNKMRIELRGKNIRVELVKNSLAQRALMGTKLESIGQLLSGPSALVTGGDSIVDVAREIMDYAKKYTGLEVRGAVVEGQVLDEAGAQMLSKMPSRVELQGQIITIANSPGSKLAGQIVAPASRIAGCIKTQIEKLEEKEGGSVAA